MSEERTETFDLWRSERPPTMLSDRDRVTLETSRSRFEKAAVELPTLNCWVLFSDDENVDLFTSAAEHPRRREFGRMTIYDDYSLNVAFSTTARIQEEQLGPLADMMRPAGAAVRSCTWLNGEEYFLVRKWGDGFYNWLSFLGARELQSGRLDRRVPIRDADSNWSISWDAFSRGNVMKAGEWSGPQIERIKGWNKNPPQFFEFVIKDVLTASIAACDWLLESSAGLQGIPETIAGGQPGELGATQTAAHALRHNETATGGIPEVLSDNWFQDDEGEWLTAPILESRYDIPNSRLKNWREEGCPDLGGQKLCAKNVPGIGWVYYRMHVHQIADRRDDRGRVRKKHARLNAASKPKQEGDR